MDVFQVIQRNPANAYMVDEFVIRSAAAEVEQFRLSAATTTRATALSVIPALPPSPTLSVIPAPAAPAPALPTIPPPSSHLPAAATATATAAVAAAAPVTVRPAVAKHIIDPIVIGLERRDPLYADAPLRTQRTIEQEEATRLEASLDELYRSQSGRSRGWTKVGLEAMLKPRCASGGDIAALDRAKKAFLWAVVYDDKPTSAFLDFVCVAKQIRVAIWFEKERRVVLYPAADIPDSSPPLYHLDSTGRMRTGGAAEMSENQLLEFCAASGWTLLPPHSVLHTLQSLTLSELENVGRGLGMAEVVGSKVERVAAVAAFKLRQRLLRGGTAL